MPNPVKDKIKARGGHMRYWSFSALLTLSVSFTAFKYFKRVWNGGVLAPVGFLAAFSERVAAIASDVWDIRTTPSRTSCAPPLVPGREVFSGFRHFLAYLLKPACTSGCKLLFRLFPLCLPFFLSSFITFTLSLLSSLPLVLSPSVLLFRSLAPFPDSWVKDVVDRSNAYLGLRCCSVHRWT